MFFQAIMLSKFLFQHHDINANDIDRRVAVDEVFFRFTANNLVLLLSGHSDLRRVIVLEPLRYSHSYLEELLPAPLKSEQLSSNLLFLAVN